MTLTEYLQSLANTIRGRNQYAPEKIKAYDFNYEIEQACNESEITGYNIGLSEGIERGKQEEYDRFWDSYQDYGNKPQYTQAFRSWEDGCYKPKYPIICQKNWSTTEIFRASLIVDTRVDIEFKGNNYAVNSFYDCFNLVTIRKIKLDETTDITGNTFRSCNSLENITFEGAIGCNVDFHWSPLLTVESLRSILTALSKNSTYANGKTVTFDTASKAVIEADTVCIAHLTDAVNAGWTIAYA